MAYRLGNVHSEADKSTNRSCLSTQVLLSALNCPRNKKEEKKIFGILPVSSGFSANQPNSVKTVLALSRQMRRGPHGFRSCHFVSNTQNKPQGGKGNFMNLLYSQLRCFQYLQSGLGGIVSSRLAILRMTCLIASLTWPRARVPAFARRVPFLGSLPYKCLKYKTRGLSVILGPYICIWLRHA